jgi:Tat protein secretion system quality control protein TatD with DNase activity
MENRMLEQSPYLLSWQSRAKPNEAETLAYDLEAKLHCFDSNGHANTALLQGDQKVSVHLMITVQKQAKIFEAVPTIYHDNIVIIRDNRWLMEIRRTQLY